MGELKSTRKKEEKFMANNGAFVKNTHNDISPKRKYIIPRDWIYNGIKVLLFIADRFLFLGWHTLDNTCTFNCTHKNISIYKYTRIKSGNRVNHIDWCSNSVCLMFRRTKEQKTSNDLDKHCQCVCVCVRCHFSDFNAFYNQTEGEAKEKFYKNQIFTDDYCIHNHTIN